MYSIITTQGFVINSRPSGDAGKLLYIFTRDHGLVMATAQGIRLEKSKLRYFVQDYSFGTYSFVKGKEYWRLTNADKFIGSDDKVTEKRGELLARVAMLLKKLLHGEESNEKLFDVVSSLNKFGSDIERGGKDSNVTEKYQLLESLIVLRIFHTLGYIGDIADLNSLLITDQISLDILKIVENNKIFINRHINKAIKESHL